MQDVDRGTGATTAMGSARVQKKNGAFCVLIPVDLAREQGLEAGDELPSAIMLRRMG
jgi:hypothetical protein